MQLAIRFDRGEGLNLYVDGVSEHLYFDYETRVEALRKANERLDKDLCHAANLYPNECRGAFLWCYTAEFIRGENVTDLLKVYFILALLATIIKKARVDQITIEYDFPRDAIQELKQMGCSMTYAKGFYTGIIREWAKVVYHAAKAIKSNIQFFISKTNPIHKGNLIDVNRSPRNNRLDSLSNYSFLSPYKVFSGQEHTLSGFSENDIVVFRRENSFIDGIAQFFRTIQVLLFIKKNKTRLPVIYRSFFRVRDFFRLWDLLLYEKASATYFSKSAIANLIHVSTLTKPTYRILWAQAKKYGVKVINVASRTLKSLSSSERLLTIDLNAYSGTCLPDNIIVRDQFSKDCFKGMPLYKQVTIGGRYKSIGYKTLEEKKDKVLYLVLTHIKECSDVMLSDVSSYDYKKHGIATIVFRSHPAARYTEADISRYFGGYQIEDNTGKSIDVYQDKLLIMVSGPTTGALELVTVGAALVWMPYIWKDGILFDGLMSYIGQKVLSKRDYQQKLDHLLKDDLEEIIKENKLLVNRYFDSSHLISEKLSTLIQ